MKKLLFTAYSLEIGGIEKALVNLLRSLDYTKYEVTLILEKKEGVFLEQIPYDVRILEYRISDSSCVLWRKVCNRLKLWSWKLKLHNKYDFSCSFATYSIPGAHLALCASANNCLWLHSNYYVLYNNDENLMQKFLNGVFVGNFKRVVFVSEDSKRDVCAHYNGLSKKAIVCNNFVNGEEIVELAKEESFFKRDKKIPLFVNVGRHEEFSKRLSRILQASAKLKKNGYKFQVLFIGDGVDSLSYDEQIRKLDLEDVIINLGSKKNPYPYYKQADAVVLSSEYEGFPVVFLEAMILGKPILSTKVSDWEKLDKKYGIFCNKDENSVYKMMKKYLDEGFLVKEKFDFNSYNEQISNVIDKLIEGNDGEM